VEIQYTDEKIEKEVSLGLLMFLVSLHASKHQPILLISWSRYVNMRPENCFILHDNFTLEQAMKT
jgi:hypothetical protein